MATILAFIALVAVSSALAPQLTRRDIFFGVTVAPGFRDGDVARSISRRYAIEIWFLAAVAALLAVTAPMPEVSGTTLLAQTIGASLAFARARRAVRPHAVVAASLREADLGQRSRLPGGLVAQVGPFLILLAAAAYVGWHWEAVPARFPTHWNLAGRPDGWTSKSVANVFRGLALGLVSCTMLLFTSYAVLHWTRTPRVTGSGGVQDRRVRSLNLIAMLCSEYLLATLIAWTLVVPMFSERAAQARLPLAFRLAPFALFIVGTSAIRVVRRLAVTDGAPVGDTTPDSCWIFGRLYLNRADPTLFVEKRMGLGYTLNLGNPWSWLVMASFAFAIAVPFLLGT